MGCGLMGVGGLMGCVSFSDRIQTRRSVDKADVLVAP